MADSPAAVEAFLTELAQKARAKGEADWEEVKTFAKEKLGLNEVHPWDAAWVSESLRRAKYAYSDHEVKRYFTLPAVFSGMFRLVEKLFDVRISEDSAPVWHDDVKLWRISDASGNLIARFYTDLYARASKRGGAWMDSDTTYCVLPDGTVRTPVAYLVCNFSAARRRQASASHARRRHDALSRIRPRSASHALARTAGATFRH